MPLLWKSDIDEREIGNYKESKGRIKFKLDFEFDFKEDIGKVVYESIKKELKEENERFFIAVNLEGKKLFVCIETDDVVMIRAAANTWLRLIKISEEMVQVVKEFSDEIWRRNRTGG